MLLSVTSVIDSVVQFITVLFIFVFVLGITYFTTRYIAGIQKEQYRTGNMELIETLRISNNKYLQIVRVADKYFCMAECKCSYEFSGYFGKNEAYAVEKGKTRYQRGK